MEWRETKPLHPSTRRQGLPPSPCGAGSPTPQSDEEKILPRQLFHFTLRLKGGFEEYPPEKHVSQHKRQKNIEYLGDQEYDHRLAPAHFNQV